MENASLGWQVWGWVKGGGGGGGREGALLNYYESLILSFSLSPRHSESQNTLQVSSNLFTSNTIIRFI